MSKPEVVGYASSEGLDAVRSESQAVFIYPTPVGFGEHASQALIRLTDHEAAMAEVSEEQNYWRKRCQSLIDQTTPLEPVPGDPMWSRRIELDAVMAQRNELLGLLRQVRMTVGVTAEALKHRIPPRAYESLRQECDRIDATLAKHGDNQC